MPPIPKKPKKRHLAPRVQIVTLRFIANKSLAEIARLTGLSDRTVASIIKRAVERGFDPARTDGWQDEWFEDAPRSGRPSKQSDEARQVVEQLLRLERDDGGGGGGGGGGERKKKTYTDVAAELAEHHGINVSATTVWRMIKASQKSSRAAALAAGRGARAQAQASQAAARAVGREGEALSMGVDMDVDMEAMMMAEDEAAMGGLDHPRGEGEEEEEEEADDDDYNDDEAATEEGPTGDAPAGMGGQQRQPLAVEAGPHAAATTARKRQPPAMMGETQPAHAPRPGTPLAPLAPLE
jgi:transposase